MREEFLLVQIDPGVFGDKEAATVVESGHHGMLHEAGKERLRNDKPLIDDGILPVKQGCGETQEEKSERTGAGHRRKMPETPERRKGGDQGRVVGISQNGVLIPIARIAHQPLIASKTAKAPLAMAPQPQKAWSVQPKR